MKEHSIIMSGNHPKLIIDGIKTMTRRVIKPPPTFHYLEGMNIKLALMSNGKGKELKCPYGQAGDRLWVRETHIFEIDEDASPNAHYDKDEDMYLIPHYKADGEDISDWTDFETGDMGGKWRPSIFMPRWASRITLEITEVRVERLQEISYEDARLEGCSNEGMLQIRRFGQLWDSLNAKRGYGWDKNPWVWVMEFKVV